MGSELYNKLPEYIKEIESYETFRKQLNHSFFSMPFIQ
jgi:hypothetical protein